MSFHCKPSILVLLSLLSSQTEGQRGDVEPEIELGDGSGPPATAAAAATCSCSGSVVAAVFVTAAVIFLLGGLWWFVRGRKAKLAKPTNPETFGNAAYDNPQFQGDDIDQVHEGQTRITIEPGPQIVTTTQCTTTTIATNTTSTLERGKTTIERVMAAIIRGSRSDSSKKAKDDSYLMDKDVIVPLQSHDFAGLGFTVHGNLKEGLYVKEVLNRGPASQSGQVIQGDRIIALTILTEHIVFKDALTILSCASPYPVLLHLKKRKPLTGSFSSSSSSKGKLNSQSSESSLSLMHPAFRSQSQGDLSKIGDDSNHLGLGNLMPPFGRSPAISQKIPKCQPTRAEQRKTENRHSERAIDVPGVTIKSGTIAVDIDGIRDDKRELANVQVHRSMSSNIGAKQETSIELPTFKDSQLSETAENLRNVEVQIDYNKPNPKTKFGVKVFPDLAFAKGTNKVLDRKLGSENKEAKIDISDITIPKLAQENDAMAQNKENSQIELNIGVNTLGLKKDIDLKTSHEFESERKFNVDRDYKIDLPDINLPSYSSSTDKSMPLDSNIEINTEIMRLQNKSELSQSLCEGTVSRESDDSFQLKMPDVNLPSFNIKTSNSKTDEKSISNAQIDEADLNLPSLKMSGSLSNQENTESDNNKKKSSFGFNMPDISLPSLNLKDKKSGFDSNSDTDEENKFRQSHEVNLKQPEIYTPSLTAEGEIKIPKQERVSQKEIHLDMPDIGMPSFGLKKNYKSDKDNKGKEKSDDGESEELKDSEKETKKSKYEFKFGMPDLSLPSFGMRAGSDNKNVEEDSEKIAKAIRKEEEDKKESTNQEKSDYELKLGMPDINMPSFNLRKSRKNSQADNESDIEIENKNKTFMDGPDITLHAGSVKTGDLSLEMPSFALCENSKTDVKFDNDRKESSNFSIPPTSVPDIHLETGMSTRTLVDNDNNNDKKSHNGFKISMPDINMPSFSFKGNSDNGKNMSSDTDSKTVSQKDKNLDINLPSINLETILNDDYDNYSDDMESGIKIIDSSKSDDEAIKKKAKQGFKIGIPDFNMPSFNIKGNAKGRACDDNDYIMPAKNDNSVLDLDVSLPTIKVKNESKCEIYESEASGLGKLNIKMPDVSLPSVQMEGKTRVSEEHFSEKEVNLNEDIINTDIEAELRTELEKDSKEEKKKKSKHGFKIGMPDINVPSFSLKTSSKLGKDLTEGEDKIGVEQNVKTDKETTGVHLAIAKPSLSLNEDFILGVHDDTTEDNDHRPVRRLFSDPDSDKTQKDKKKSKEKTGFNFKFKGPEFSFPNFGKQEKHSKEVKHTGKFENSGPSSLETNLNIGKLEGSVANGSNDRNEVGNYNIILPSIPTTNLNFNLTQSESEIEVADDKKQDKKLHETELELPNDSTTKEVNVIVNETPDFKIPDFKMEKSEVHLNFKIPRVDMSHNVSSSKITTEDLDSKINMRSELDTQGYEISEANYSLPDELKVEVTGKTNQEFDESKINFSEIKIPDLKLRKINQNATEVSSELSEDEMNDGLNATDATKKKRFGIKINAPEVSLPSFGIKHENANENQSDEMKSFQMKYKLPTPHIVDLPSYEENIPKDDHPNMYVQLPRVKITSSKSKDFGGKDNEGNENLASPGDESSKISLSRSVENECDEWKMKEGSASIPTSNVSLLREKFNTKLKESEKLSGPKYKLELETRRGSNSKADNFDFDIDEPDFLIPDLKVQPDFKSSFASENFNISNLNIKGNDGIKLESTNRLPSYELNWQQKQEDLFNSEAKSMSFTPALNSTPVNEINVSLDSSSIEAESDLPEADSAYKNASPAFELDVPIPRLSMTKMNLEKSFIKDNDIPSVKSDFQKGTLKEQERDSFGTAFGFRGFKNHVGPENSMKNKMNIDDGIEEVNNKLPLTNDGEKKLGQSDIRLLHEPSEFKVEAMDLPEADYDIDYEENLVSSHLNMDVNAAKSHLLPEGDQNINYSIESKLKSLEESFNIKHTDMKNFPENDRNRINLEANLISNRTEAIADASKYSKEATQKGKKEDDEDKSKSKMKLGLGFGFKGFGKLSDSEDNDVDAKISKEPEGSVNDNSDKVRSKPKKTFSFKGFGKSASDTEEENLEKVSDNPMQKGSSDDKNKQITKGPIITGSRSKGYRSSDSDDNVENEKVDLNPQVAESNMKKSKIKSNLGFGFMHKSKAMEQENHPDIAIENKKEQHSPDEDIKMKSKGKINLGLKGSKDSKYDTRSESEGGEDEKLTMDSRGDEHRGKSKYGIGFGFRKNHGKNSSDSEGADNDEQKVYLDERGGSEKSKESKSKSLKLGFKGFKNLKGKIQTEINKMRHDSPSSDDEGNEESKNFNEKRKKVTKKKEKDKKMKRDSEKYLDASEEATLSSAAYAAKDNRRKKSDRKSSTSSSSSSSESSSGDEEKSVEQKKKKKSHLKRKDDNKLSTPVINVKTSIPQSSNEYVIKDEIVSSSYKSNEVLVQNDSESHVTVVMSEPNQVIAENITVSTNKNTHMEMQSDPRNYVVVREMKLKENIPKEISNVNHVNVEGTHTNNKFSQPYYLKQSQLIVNDSENGGFWGSDSDMERGKIMDGEVNLSSTSVALNTSGTKRVLTDSEELKRKATSLGDLSRLHEGMLTGTLLERAVSLDLKNASVGPPNLHIRRLQLPDSSATSIDEVDESTVSPSTKKSDLVGFMKSASQWGTLEEAMHLGDREGSNKQLKIESTMSSPLVFSQSTIVKTTTTDEGAPISNIEISGERGSSVTALSAKKPNWDDSFEDEEIPSLPSSPIPVEKTTITVMEDDRATDSNEFSGSDSNIVVVGSEPVQAINNFHNLNFHLHPSMTPSYETHILSSHGRMSSSNTSVNSDSGRYSPRNSTTPDDVGGVTITMVPAESHLNAVSNDHISLLSKASKTLSCPPDLVNYDVLQQSSLVTVSHDLLQENGEIIIETTEHNVSDEYITPDSTPQKSMTQITLEGDGVSGYTVTEGTISRTVIIANPDSSSPVNIVQTTDKNDIHLT